MPVATPSQYAAMIDAAQAGDYAFPAINVTSLVTINAALKAFSDQRCDGIIQISLGGGGFASGLNVADNVVGAIVLAEAAHRLAAEYESRIAAAPQRWMVFPPSLYLPFHPIVLGSTPWV